MPTLKKLEYFFFIGSWSDWGTGQQVYDQNGGFIVRGRWRGWFEMKNRYFSVNVYIVIN